MTLPGLNIQAPWAEAIVSGPRVIETRFYSMPKKLGGTGIRYARAVKILRPSPGLLARLVQRTSVKPVLGPMRTPGDDVVMDNWPVHQAVGVQQALARRGARLRSWPP